MPLRAVTGTDSETSFGTNANRASVSMTELHRSGSNVLSLRRGMTRSQTAQVWHHLHEHHCYLICINCFWNIRNKLIDVHVSTYPESKPILGYLYLRWKHMASTKLIHWILFCVIFAISFYVPVSPPSLSAVIHVWWCWITFNVWPPLFFLIMIFLLDGKLFGPSQEGVVG